MENRAVFFTRRAQENAFADGAFDAFFEQFIAGKARRGGGGHVEFGL